MIGFQRKELKNIFLDDLLSSHIEPNHIYLYRVIRKNKLKIYGVFNFSTLSEVVGYQQEIEDFIDDGVLNAIEGLKLWGNVRKVAIKNKIK